MAAAEVEVVVADAEGDVRSVIRKVCENGMAACSICLGDLELARCFGALDFYTIL